MGKRLWILISLVLTVFLIWWISKPSNDTTIVYHLPEGFKGCINIYFNQPNQKELEIIDDILLFVVPELITIKVYYRFRVAQRKSLLCRQIWKASQ